MLSIPSKKTIILTVLFLLVTITTGYAANQTTSGTLSSQVGTDPNTGAANVSVPIEVPPGRNGMAPNLALTYNSNKRNGWIGVGWNIKTSFIQRNTKWGLDYSDDDYVADGNRELVARSDWGTDYYGHKTEGTFIKYYFNSTTGGWEATTKNGTKHYYGSTAASRQDNPNNSSEVFKWMIDKVEDTNGNYVTYTYIKDQGELYLEQIDYTGGNGRSPTNYVKLYYDNTRTDAYAMYTTNFSVTTAKRLITIKVVSNESIVRAYKLVYDADPQTPGSQYSISTDRSVLYSVQQYGTDTALDANGYVMSGSSLPFTCFEYQKGSTGEFTFSQSLPGASVATNSFISANKNIYTGDWNGDGKTDLLHIHPNADPQYSWVALSNGNGTFTFSQSLPGASVATNSYISANKNIYTGDWNGDGKTDLLHIHPNTDPQYSWVAL